MGGARQGNYARGERAAAARLDEARVRQVRSWLAEGKTLRWIAAQVGVSFQAISSIRRGLTWRHIT